MAKITNPTRSEIILPTMHIVPRLGSLETTDDVLRCSDNWPMVAGLLASGTILVEFDPVPEAAPAAKGKSPATASS